MMLPIDQDFKSYITSNWPQLVKEQGNVGRNAREASPRVYSLYRNVLEKEVPFIVIGSGIRNNKTLIANFGLATSSLVLKKKKIEVMVNTLAGAILGENPWSVVVNDVFMLAAIHRACDVHLALSKHKMPSKDELWDKEKKCFKPLGRELAILVACNYHRQNLPLSLGVVFSSHCGDSQNNSSLTLSELRKRIACISLNDVQDFLHGNKENEIKPLENDESSEREEERLISGEKGP